MAYRNTPTLNLPLKQISRILSQFKDGNIYDRRFWGVHLGIDIAVKANTEVYSIGRGNVVYSKLHPGEFTDDGKILKRNWGGIMILAHKNPKNKNIFYSLYGHLGKRYVKEGDSVEIGELIGLIGKSMTESNGIWENEHLHFSIYSGPYHAKVLPGYYKENLKNTSLKYWKEPLEFIKKYKPRYV